MEPLTPPKYYALRRSAVTRQRNYFRINSSEAVTGSGIEEWARFFVACFSYNGDELGQWRGYAANGRRYAFGFDGPILERSFLSLGMDLPSGRALGRVLRLRAIH
jgi:hypothetical protein